MPAGIIELTRRTRLIVAAMLGASCACNVLVLFLPFMELRKGFGTEPYSLVRSVDMMWSTGLYVLAVLVVGFSIVFPFAKLAILAGLAARGRLDATGRRALEWVERLGKWSMLDVFLVCLILTLTSGQLMVGAKPLAGIPIFVAAITLSMAAGALLAREMPPEASRPLHRPINGWWLALAGIVLAGTLAMPFLQIRDWLLADKAYSVVTLTLTLLRQGAWIGGLVVAVFLVLAPLGAWVTAFDWWRRHRNGIQDEAAHRRMLQWRHWSMLDVFGLALAVFLVEGEQLMHTEVRWGALFLVAMLAVRWAIDLMLDRARVAPVESTTPTDVAAPR